VPARLVAVALACLPLLGACAVTPAAADGRLQVVASTSVYGSIVRAVAGPRVDVTSFIDDPAQDPHSFQASARDELAIAHAGVIVENGGGYDDFMDRMRQAAAPSAVTINLVRLSGHRAAPGGELNEHVWYDLGTIDRFVARLVAVLTARRPGQASAFRAGAARFTARLHALQRAEASIRSRYAGTPVAITEPLPGYLLRACGLVNRTPAKFSTSIESGTDAPVSVLAATLRLFDSHTVRVLVYNEQTTGAETTRVLAAAAANHVPVVPVTESLPAGQNYLSWMHNNLAALQRALSKQATR
jgi:zinc/manganese transport system substrate-binding protein